jgi:cytochrome P450
MTELHDLVNLESPEFYDVRNSGILARIRSEAPVYFSESIKSWVLSRYDDIKYAERTPELFTVQRGTILNDAQFGMAIEVDFFDHGAELISMLDPPRHGEVRRTIAPAFTPRTIAQLEHPVRAIVRDTLTRVTANEPVEFVTQVARVIPTRAVAQLVGVPPDDVDVEKIIYWADELFKVGAPLSPEELAGAANNARQMKGFLLDLLEQKRTSPGSDLMSALAAAELDRTAISKANIVMLAEMVLTAGIDTTRNTMAATVWALAQHPEQMRRLVADPGLIAQTVEEVLRWVTPVPGFLRSATRDVEIRGQTIRGGDYVYLLYFAANRDEDCWGNADDFDITRATDPGVLSFGFGQHVCIGAALARMEVRVLLEELLHRFSSVELAGPSQRVPSPMQYGWSSLPVVFRDHAS